MSTDQTHDGVLIGAGHNALVLQAYLGRAGLKTVCLERRSVAGGGLSSRRPAASGIPSQHALLLPSSHKPDALVQRSEPAAAWRFWNPSSMCVFFFRMETHWSGGPASTGQRNRLRRSARKTRQKMRRWRDEFVTVLDDILTPESQSPPIPGEQRTKSFGTDLRGPSSAGGQQVIAS